MRGAVKKQLSDDEGFTLIELLVYSLLLIVVISIIAAMFIASSRTQTSVGNVTTATTSGQAVSRSVENGIRSSTAFKLVVSGSDQMVVARTLLPDSSGTVSCMAWYYSASGTESIRYERFTTALSAVPNAATLATWGLLASGLSPVTGTTIFTRATATDPTLSLSFKVLAGTLPAVPITTSAVSRVNGTDVSSCYTGS